jgi:hypothetical protein
MSVSTEVQRTIVKSPPELWAELSDPEALSRHLDELGEIRITRAEPETTLEWEAEGAKGAVQLKASGFGTKVTLSLTREVPEPQALVEPEPQTTAEPETEQPAAAGPEPPNEPEPVAEQPEPGLATKQEPISPGPEREPEPEPRRGFFARMFRRRGAEQIVPAPPIEPEPIAVIEPEPVAAVELESGPEEPAVDLAAELAAMEAQIAEQTTELLIGVLDSLGAAHHRPFSRG